MVKSETTTSRVSRSKDQAKNSYNRLSRYYDTLAGSEKPYIDQGLQMLDLQEGETALEVGFGTGYAMIKMARAVGDTGEIYGVDLSDGMLMVARQAVSQAGLEDRVTLKIGDATSLPFDDDLFTAIFISFTLELFDTPEIPIVLHECSRVIKKSGRIVVVAMSKHDNPGLAVRLYEWAHERFPVTLDCRPIFAQQALREAGFQIVETRQEVMWGLPVEIVLAKETS